MSNSYALHLFREFLDFINLITDTLNNFSCEILKSNKNVTEQLLILLDFYSKRQLTVTISTYEQAKLYQIWKFSFHRSEDKGFFCFVF